ncbi:MAG: AAA family ATPase, partial [Anaerolineae bacterium]
MHRTVPDLIVDNYRAGRRRGFFPAAALFVDTSGFSTITDVLMRHGQPGAEELTRLMRSVFDPLIGGTLAYGGEVVGLAGDAVTAVFDASEDMDLAVRRALAAAWSIQARLKEIGSLTTDYGEFRISAKIGVAAGEVHWGILESSDGNRATYYVRGSAIDESAAAERQALAGEILLSPAAHEALAGAVQSNERGRLHLVKELEGPSVERCPIQLQPVDAEVARIFAPDALLTQSLRGELRQAVNLFLRIPDLPDEGLANFIAAVFDLQEQYGGLISRIDFGDKGCNLLMMWGAPVTYENDIGRALNFILGLQARFDLPITAGLTFYMALAGFVGSEHFEDYTCYGWGVNLAARFMMSAQDGTVWLDERIVQRTHRAFSTEYLGEQNFKGFAQKQKVYILKGRKAETDSFYDGRLAGRDAELRVLEEAVEPLRRNEPAGLLLVTGEAGIGKSRLVHEFKASSLFAEWRVLWAVCQSDQVLRQSFNPLRYWLLRYFDFLTMPDETARLEALNARLDELRDALGEGTLADDLERARSFLAALVDLHWTDSPYERMDAQGRYDNTVLALMALFKAESCRQPVILLIEDAHFIDEDSQAFLLRFKRSLASERSYPIAILVTSRPEARGIGGEEGFADRRLDLSGLPAEAITALSDDILGRPAAADLVRFITLRAEGNPFFAEQILRYLQEEGVLELSDAGRWVIRRGWQSSALPADISTMLVARLDQLARQVKDVIQTASVLGREFEVHVLARMLDDDPTLDVRVSEAERASIWSPLNELRYLFRHSLLRDAAYSMQLQAHRRELHALAVQALESLYADELTSHYPELAFHSEQAALKEKAQFYLRRAADAARDAYQNAEALDYYGRVLRLTKPEELRERLNLTIERVALLRRMGNWDTEAAELDALDIMAQGIGDPAARAKVRLLRAEHMLNSGDFRQTIAYAEQALELARTVMDAETSL